MFSWFKNRRARETRTIPISHWRAASAPYLFMRGMPAGDSERLRLLAGEFLGAKHISAAAELKIDDLMRAQIAAQACILILELGIDYYKGWSDVILYPGQFVPEREVVDEAGVVHLTRDPLAGEAWLGGPVILSYEDVAMAGDELARVAGYNVVIHEFAHKLDMLNGEPNGYPPLHKGMSVEGWKRDFMAAYLDFCRRVDAADAQVERGHPGALDALPIDPYASENPAEFFAVISEAFFEAPDIVNSEYPAVYAQLRAFYKQDPLLRLTRQIKP
jgi:MtfA peptidase